jgi:hypothetical protein
VAAAANMLTRTKNLFIIFVLIWEIN